MSTAIRYVLDTDMCIYLLNGDPRVKDRSAQVGVESISVAIPTVAELYFGAYSSARVAANLARVRAFLAPPGPEGRGRRDEAGGTMRAAPGPWILASGLWPPASPAAPHSPWVTSTC